MLGVSNGKQTTLLGFWTFNHNTPLLFIFQYRNGKKTPKRFFTYNYITNHLIIHQPCRSSFTHHHWYGSPSKNRRSSIKLMKPSLLVSNFPGREQNPPSDVLLEYERIFLGGPKLKVPSLDLCFRDPIETKKRKTASWLVLPRIFQCQSRQMAIMTNNCGPCPKAKFSSMPLNLYYLNLSCFSLQKG